MADDPKTDRSSTPCDVRLSIVVTVVDGAEAVARCLVALDRQEQAPPMEVIVPFDESDREIASLSARFPNVRLLDLGDLRTARSAESVAGQHELYDRRRSAGLAASRGELIALLEDRGVPAAGWAAAFDALHKESPAEVIGGAVENGVDRYLNWAVYFCDFGRYQLPFESGQRSFVTDVNICYKRRALEATKAVWLERYHETSVHWELQRVGAKLVLAREPVVYQHRSELTLPRLFAERLHWGRLFAYTRALESGILVRLARTATAPLLPLVLFGRLVVGQLRRRTRWGRFVSVAPLVLLLLTTWSLGEAWGYLTKRP